MRLPNSFGNVSKLPGNRRKPYRARITIGWETDESGKNYPTLKKLKILFNVMYKYAMENDLVSKDYSQFVDIAQYRDRNPNKYDRKPFSREEITTIWKWNISPMTPGILAFPF